LSERWLTSSHGIHFVCPLSSTILTWQDLTVILAGAGFPNNHEKPNVFWMKAELNQIVSEMPIRQA